MATRDDVQAALAKSVTALSRTLADQTTHIDRLETALAGEQKAYSELQARLSILTSLVVSTANTVGLVIHFLRMPLIGVERKPEEGAETLALFGHALSNDLTTTLSQMGVDLEVLLEATGVTLEPETPPDGESDAQT